MHFLQELVQDYLILAHPQADLPQIEHAEEITHGDKEEISTGKPAPVDFVIPFGILAVQFAVPSVICAGISFLTLAALFIFCKKDTMREFHKKLRM